MSEWAARLGLLFPERAKIDFDLFVDETVREGHNFLFDKDYDEDNELKPSYEQISQERILDEASKNIQILKSLETILQERTQSYSTFFAAQGKCKPSFEIFQYCEGTLRQALDALFVFLEQELQQARQQQTLGDLRKALSEVKLNAQKRLLDYQREVTIADKDVAAAEKKLLKSKSFSEKNYDHKHRVDSTRQERLREYSDSVTSTDKDIKVSIQCLLKALSARDQVLVASRRAHQRLDRDCKKAVALTFRKFLVRERESAIARETVLAKLESAVNNIDVDGDLDDFIIQHRQGDEGSLHCCSQALAVLEDLLPLEEQLLSDSHSHTQPASNTKPLTSRDRKEIHTSHVPFTAVDGVNDQESFLKGNPSSKSSGLSRSDALGETQPTPLHLHLIESETSRTVGESPAELKRRIDGKEVDEQSCEYLELTKDQIIQHLSRIFYCQLSPKSVENILSSSSSPRHRTFFRDGTSSSYENVGSRFRSSCNDTDNSSPTRSNLMEVSTSNPIAHSSSSSGSSSSSSNKSPRPGELYHPLSVSHNNYISFEENVTFEKDRHDSIQVKSSLTDDSNPVNIQSIENDQSKKYHSNFSTDNILGTNIADDFYSCKGSISGHSHITGLNSPGFCIKSGFSDDDSVDNLGLSAQFLSNVVKTQEGRNAFIVELNQFRSKKVELGVGFRVLGNILWDALDRCKEDNDVRSAKVIMMLSQTFYRRLMSTKAMLKFDSSADSLSTLEESSSAIDFVSYSRSKKEAERKVGVVADLGMKVVVEDGAESGGQTFIAESDDVGDDDRLADRGASSREYLKATLMAHDLWKDQQFWEQALWQCTVEQVMALTHSMIELGCSKLQTREFLHRMCALHELSERQRQDLLAHLMSR